MELAASEAERARLVAAARTAELASRALRAQLAEAGAAFRAAMATAQGFLQQGTLRLHKPQPWSMEAIHLLLVKAPAVHALAVAPRRSPYRRRHQALIAHGCRQH